MMLTRWLVTLSLLLWVGTAQATIIINEDYEVVAGNIHPTSATGDALEAKGWAIVCSGGSTCPATTKGDIVTSPVHSGSKALRYTYDLGENGTNNNAKRMSIAKNFAGVTEIWDRYWTQWVEVNPGQGHLCDASNTCTKLHYWNPSNADPISNVSAYFGLVLSGVQSTSPSFTSGGSFTRVCPNGNTDVGCNYVPNLSGLALPYNTWVCVLSHIKMNDPGVANGVIEVWLGATKTTNYTNVVLRTGASVWSYVQNYRQTGNNTYRYEDDWVVATTQAETGGCGSAPIPTDTVPPSPPTGLTVQ